MQYPRKLIQKIQNKRNDTTYYVEVKKEKKRNKKIKKDEIIDPINWKCECGAGFHHYFITCHTCGKENRTGGNGLPISS